MIPFGVIRARDTLRAQAESYTSSRLDLFTTVSYFLNSFSPVHSIRVRNRSGQSTPLLELCLNFNHARSALDLDRIYSLLGLASDQSMIVPDYDAPAARVYTELSGQYITRTSSLLPLVFSSERNSYPGLPSWVIDWTVWRETMPSPRKCWLDILLSFNSCGDLPQTAPVVQGNRLSLSGVQVDWVSGVGKAMDPDDQRYKYLEDWTELVRTSSYSHKAYPSGCSLKEAWWRTLCLDSCLTLHSSRRASRKEIDELKKVLGFYCSGPAEPCNPDAPDTEDSKVENVVEGQSDTKFAPALTNYMFHTYHVFTPNHKMFVTDKGYIGLGGENTAINDKVFVVPGLQVPLLLRPANEDILGRFPSGSQTETYSLVGECYVHGIMDGEIARDQGCHIKPLVIV